MFTNTLAICTGKKVDKIENTSIANSRNRQVRILQFAAALTLRGRGCETGIIEQVNMWVACGPQFAPIRVPFAVCDSIYENLFINA